MLGCCLSIRWVASDVVVTLILSERERKDYLRPNLLYMGKLV